MPKANKRALTFPPESTGRRERNKAEKLQRIKDAARDLFARRGYDETTTADVAEAADIGMSTLFFYADDKRDLLFLIFNEWFGQVLDELEARQRGNRNVTEALLELFQPLYAHHRRAPKLSRATLRELNFFSSGKHAPAFIENSRRIVLLIEGVLRNAVEKEKIAPNEDIELVASTLFAIYQAEIRRFMASDESDIDAALGRLRRMLRLVIDGLIPRKGTAKSSARPRTVK